MNVSLSSELESWIEQRVASGLYSSASEVVREALRTLREREEARALILADLRAELRVGADQLDAGGGVPLDDDLVAGVKARGRKRLAERRSR